jgi:hypothetical protein
VTSLATFEPLENAQDMPEPAAALLELWQGFREQGARPTRQDFTPFALKRWIGHLDIYRVEDGGRDFRIRLNGTRVTELTGEDWTGRSVRDVDRRFNSTFYDEVHAVFASRRPAVHRTRIYQKNFTTAHRLMLPIFSAAGDGEVVEILMALFGSGNR